MPPEPLVADGVHQLITIFSRLTRHLWLAQVPKTIHAYDVCPRKDKRGVDLVSDVLPFGRLWYGEPNAVSNAIVYAEHRSCSHDAVIRVYDEAGNVIQTHEHKGEFKEW
jgi:hypothetical protein